MGTTAIESFPSVELINEVVQRFKMTCRFFLSVFMFSYCLFLSSTSLVLRGKRFLGFCVYQVSATGPRRRPPKARRRGMGCMGMGCTPVVPVVVEDLWG